LNTYLIALKIDVCVFNNYLAPAPKIIKDLGEVLEASRVARYAEVLGE